jgi:hypothetical protein
MNIFFAAGAVTRLAEIDDESCHLTLMQSQMLRSMPALA